MRDPARIARITTKLARAWEAAPDMRLGQLTECIRSDSGRRLVNLFNLEDDAFEEALDKWLSKPDSYIQPKSPEDKPLRGYRATTLIVDEYLLPPPKS